MVRKIHVGAPISSIKHINDWQIVCGTHSGAINVWDLRKYQKIK
jgi:hypothetical protein